MAYVIQAMHQKGFDAEEIAKTFQWPLKQVKKYIR